MQSAELALRKNRIDHFNQMVDTTVVTFFLVMIAGIFAISVWEWLMLLSRRRVAMFSCISSSINFARSPTG